MSWTALTLDLSKSTPAMFKELVDNFGENCKQHTIPRLTLSDGWHTITPQLAEHILQHNPVGANRKASLATVRYYADQIVSKDWRKTGQPIIISDAGLLLDGQHRCWACYFTGQPFESYVVTNVPHFDSIFAYIDNGKSRTVADALFTADFNGRSSVIAQVLKIARNYDAGAYTPKKTKTLPKMTPPEALRYISQNTTMQQTAHLQLGEYESATSVVGYKDVAIFVAWKIQQTFGDEVLEDFMTSLGSGEEFAKGNPLKLFRDKLKADRGAPKPMSKADVLGHMILTFNAWHLKKMLNRLVLDATAPFPKFIEPVQQEEAA